MVSTAAQGVGAAGDTRDIDCRVTKCVAITFDDGPGLSIDKLLTALDDAGARATFFVLGDVSAARPASLKRIAAAGHEIGSHTWDHEALPTLTDEQIRSELTRSADVIEKITGARPELLRPPYGSLSARVTGILGARQWPIILWDLDPEDWKDRDADTVYKRVVARTRPGSIVLLHDIHATTVAAVPRILATLADRGYTFVTVSELYGRTLTVGEVYYDRVDAYVGKKAAAIKPAEAD
ncbi:MAG: polysaccharide deacetylase family protein [Sporichthya sp.]|nr:polysaccharide deacetylase family protein [Sporichthya sp.]